MIAKYLSLSDTIQIQLLLKLNDLSDIPNKEDIKHSNTTLVKVKLSGLKQSTIIFPHSNTTLVKVK